METPFVIKFIETKWHDKQTLVSVSESEYSLKLEQTGNNAFSAHTTIYPKVDELRFAQLAIKLSRVISLRLTLSCLMVIESS